MFNFWDGIFTPYSRMINLTVFSISIYLFSVYIIKQYNLNINLVPRDSFDHLNY